uniref:Uncharacterized protein n=1 Tax=Rhizophora mucronata TaxID=61149 RepID=A0A2P2LK06_RHIMU
MIVITQFFLGHFLLTWVLRCFSLVFLLSFCSIKTRQKQLAGGAYCNKSPYSLFFNNDRELEVISDEAELRNLQQTKQYQYN